MYDTKKVLGDYRIAQIKAAYFSKKVIKLRRRLARNPPLGHDPVYEQD